MFDDTIAAIATPLGEGGLAVIRVSGKDALAVSDRCFEPVGSRSKKPSTAESHTIHYGKIVRAGQQVDEVLCAVMRSPRTYTREDVVEITCHGGILSTKSVLDTLLESGARLAEPGEFTRRAFLNGRLDLAQAEAVADLIHSRERLNQLMGLYGEQINWKTTGRLEEMPGEEIDMERLEARVIEQSADLKLAAQRIITAGHRLGFSKTTALIPWLDLGVESEKTDEWEVGPALSFPIPLFDQGRPRVARNRAELRQEQERYTAFAVEIRSIARQYRNHLEAAKDMVRHYRQVILPLRERITNETQLQYNAMQVGLLELLRAREQQIEAGKAYIHTLYEYWSAKTAVELLLKGRVPRPIETIEGPVPFNPVPFGGEQ